MNFSDYLATLVTETPAPVLTPVTNVQPNTDSDAIVKESYIETLNKIGLAVKRR